MDSDFSINSDEPRVSNCNDAVVECWDDLAYDWKQYRAIVWKELKVKLKKKYRTLAEIMIPFLATLVLYLIFRYSATDDELRDDNKDEIYSITNWGAFLASLNQVAATSPTLIGLAPAGPLTEELASYLFDRENITSNYRIFRDEEELINYAKKDMDYPSRIYAGILLGEISSSSLQYTIRMNHTMVPDTNRIEETADTVPEDGESLLEQYTRLGFMTIMNEVNSFAVSVGLGLDPKTSLRISDVKIQVAPTRDYEENAFYELSKYYFPIFLPLVFLFPVWSFVENLVREKQSGFKKALLTIGVKQNVYALGMLTASLLTNVLVAITILCFFTLSIFPNTSPGLLLCLLLFFSTSLTTSYHFFSIFIDRSIFAFPSVAVSSAVSVLPYVFLRDYEGSAGKILTSLVFCPTGMLFAIESIVNYEKQGQGLDADNRDDGEFSVNDSMVCIIISGVLYYFAAIFVSSIAPNQGSEPREMKELLQPLKRCSKPVDEARLPLMRVQQADIPTAVENVPSNVVAKSTVQFVNVYKVMRGNVVMNPFTMGLYSDEIAVLLGNESSGKSVLCGMLTGYTQPTSGDVFFYGRSIIDSTSFFRKYIGVAPKENIIVPELTVEEHLEFYVRLRLIESSEEPDKEVVRLSHLFGLNSILKVSSNMISPENARKLSLAQCFVGEPNLMFFDSPTRGMDIHTRSNFWTLLRKLRENRSILVVTDNIDEAHQIGDRIGIISDGQLQCHGSIGFLESWYGLGYDVRLHKNASFTREHFVAFLTVSFPRAKIMNEDPSSLDVKLPIDTIALGEFLGSESVKNPALGISSFHIHPITFEKILSRLTEQEDIPSTANTKQKLPRPASLPSLADYQQINQIKLSGFRLFASQVYAIIRKRIDLASRKKIFYLCLYTAFTVVLLLSASIAKSYKQKSWPRLWLNQEIYPPEYVSYINSEQSALRQCCMEDQLSILDANPVTTIDEMTAFLVNKAAQENSPLVVGAYFLNQTAATVYTNISHFHSAPTMLNILHTTLARNLSASKDYVISVSSHPLPQLESEDDEQRDIVNAIAYCIMCLVYFAFAYEICFFVLLETRRGFRQLQIVSGIRPLAYWLGNFIVDYVFYMALVLVTIAVYNTTDVQFWVAENQTLAFSMILFSFGAAVIPFSYFVSVRQKRSLSGRFSTFWAIFVLSLFMVVVYIVMSEMDSVSDFTYILYLIFALNPPFVLSFATLKLAVPEFCRNIEEINECTPLSWEVAIRDSWTLVGLGVLYMTILHLVERFKFILPRLLDYLVHLRTPIKGDRPMDFNVAPDNITMRSLTKYLVQNPEEPKQLFKNVTLEVDRSSPVIVLGKKGSGKSAMTSILTRSSHSTSGLAAIKGYSVEAMEIAASGSIGYCPQNDCLVGMLSGRQHLELFARIKGLPEEDIERHITSLLSTFNLLDRADRLVKYYDVGSKRLLNVAIALVGHPEILILDEPSCRMDLSCRRIFWDRFDAISKDKCTLMTSRSMSECDVLDKKVAVLLNGRIECLGTVGDAYTQYGGKYLVEIEVDVERFDPLQVFMLSTFKWCELRHQGTNFAIFEIPRHKHDVDDVIQKINAARQGLSIKEFYVSTEPFDLVFKMKEPSSVIKTQNDIPTYLRIPLYLLASLWSGCSTFTTLRYSSDYQNL